MPIKISQATEKNNKIRQVQNDISNILKNEILNEVPTIKKSLEDTLQQITKVEFKNKKSKLLKDKIYSKDEILDAIKEASGYTKWKFDTSELVDEDEIESTKETFNIDFNEKEIFRHMFYRSTNDRNALCTIFVTALPGLFEVSLHTDRVGYGLDGLVTMKQFKSSIAAESE